MNYKRLLVTIFIYALSGWMVETWAQESSNNQFHYRRGGCGGKGQSSCVIKLKVQEGDSSQVRVYRFSGDGVKNIYVDSIRSVILEKGVNSPEFNALIQKLGVEIGSSPVVYSFNCSPTNFSGGKEYCPGKGNPNCPYKENRGKGRRKGRAGAPCPANKACEAEIVIKKVVINKEGDGQAHIEVEKNIDGKVFKFEKNVSDFGPGHFKMMHRMGGLTEVERQNLKALLETPCVEELAKANPDYAQLREKLLNRQHSLPATNAPQTGKIMEKGGEVEEKINIAGSDFLCFPNPNEGTFTIEFAAPEKGGFTTLRVLDPNGKKIYEELVEAGSGKYSKTLNFPQVAKGAYTVTLENESQKRMQKVIIR
jgi:hypothetical protein